MIFSPKLFHLEVVVFSVIVILCVCTFDVAMQILEEKKHCPLKGKKSYFFYTREVETGTCVLTLRSK